MRILGRVTPDARSILKRNFRTAYISKGYEYAKLSRADYRGM